MKVDAAVPVGPLAELLDRHLLPNPLRGQHGGIAVLARRVGVSPSRLYTIRRGNEWNARQRKYYEVQHVSLTLAEAVCDACGEDVRDLYPELDVKVLGVDPGVTTGWAVIECAGVIAWGAATPDELDEVEAVARREAPDLVVIERLAPNTAHNAGVDASVLSDVEHRLLSAFPDAARVTPGAWKAHPAARQRLPKIGSKHALDAAHLALYASRTIALRVQSR